MASAGVEGCPPSKEEEVNERVNLGARHQRAADEQSRLHNQGKRMEAKEKAQQAPPKEITVPVGTPPPEAEHGSTQEPPLQVPQDNLSALEISKMAKSQNNPYLHLLDEEVNQPAE